VEMKPGDKNSLVDAVIQLADNPEFAASLASEGRPFVTANFTRDLLADRYLEILKAVANRRPVKEPPQYVTQPAPSKTSV
jgi:glycosyltransferase involved in cell wall biosynthesis